MKLPPMVRLARPEHWIKNVLVLFPVVFSLRIADANVWLRAIVAAAAFCLATSGVYVLNDIIDRDRDRLHPRKKGRPIPSGQVSVSAASAESATLIVVALLLACGVGIPVAAVILGYVVLQTVYSLWLKSKMILDVMCIALGFVLRAVAGGVAIRVEISPWLFICTFTICLFLGFCKRRSEAASIRDPSAAAAHRRTLPGYTRDFLTHLTTLSAGIAIVAYLLYATSPRTIENFGTIYLIYTLPIVIYGVCRFEMLSGSGRYVDPTDLVLHDRPFQVTVLIWAIAAAGIMFFGRDLQEWIGLSY